MVGIWQLKPIDRLIAVIARGRSHRQADLGSGTSKLCHGGQISDDDIWPVHSFRTLLQDLATLTRNIVRIGQDAPAAMLASPTPLQQDVFNRLGIPIAP